MTSFQLWELEYTSDDSVKQLVSRVGLTYGKIDFLYLNAGRQYVGEQLSPPLNLIHSMLVSVTVGTGLNSINDF